VAEQVQDPPEYAQVAAQILHAAMTSADALGPEAYPQKPTDTAEKLTGHPGSRGSLLPIGIPEGGFQSEPFTWARAGERFHVPEILHNPVNTFHQLHDYLTSGGKPTDDDAVLLAGETAKGILGMGGTTATNAIYMGSRMRDAAISGIKSLIPESEGMLMHQDGRSIRQRLPGEISRPNPDSNMFEVSKYDLEAGSQARFGQPYDKLTPDMQRWVKSQAIATMKSANDPEAVAPKLETIQGGKREVPPVASADTQPEVPVWAAIKVGDQVYKGVSHAAARLAAAKDLPEGHPIKDMLTYGEVPRKSDTYIDNLFITNKGRILPRDDAAPLAGREPGSSNKGLDSGHLYDIRDKLGIEHLPEGQTAGRYTPPERTFEDRLKQHGDDVRAAMEAERIAKMRGDPPGPLRPTTDPLTGEPVSKYNLALEVGIKG